MNEDIRNTNEATEQATGDAMHGIVDSLVSLGTVWAQHGINVGRLALKTQSTWLRGVSTLLNQVADAMEPMTRPGAFAVDRPASDTAREEHSA